MNTIIVTKINEVFMTVDCEDAGIKYELSDFFTFKVLVQSSCSHFRNKMWDGKIRLFNMWTSQLYIGLMEQLEEFCKTRGYYLVGQDSAIPKQNISTEDIVKALVDLKLPFQLETIK